ncbi:MAG: hypothetical protein Q9163_005342 [Psora crenata]
MRLFTAAVCILFAASANTPQPSKDDIRYMTVTGYFLQDLASTNATTFNFTATDFGLISQTYPTAHRKDAQKTQWQRFAAHITQLQHQAPQNVRYKVLFLGRHGEGYHNAAESYYGTPAWNCYYSILNGNATVTWADPHLTPVGVSQALAVNKFWASEIETQKIPTPQSYYTSPLTRCLVTVSLTFSGLHLPHQYPFVPIVKELFREGISGHTCDRRGSKTYIHSNFPSYRIESGFTENDELWQALHSETSIDQDIRSKTALDDVFGHDPSTYISITSHSGEIASLLRGTLTFSRNLLQANENVLVLGHRPFSLRTGAVIPVLVKAERIKGLPQTNATEAFAPICTCTSPPARTATSSECTYATATVAPPGGGPDC